MESDLLKKFCIVWASGGGRRGGAPPFNGPSAHGPRMGILTGLGASVSRLLLCRCRRLWMDMDLGFLMQRQTAIPIVGRSFLLLRGIRLCIFVPGKTLFLA